jgi:hypothetical protein
MSLLEVIDLPLPGDIQSGISDDEFEVSPADTVEMSLRRRVLPAPSPAELRRAWFEDQPVHQFALSDQLFQSLLEFSSLKPVSAAAFVEDEPPLDIGGRFSPSQALVDIWVDNLAELGKSAGLATPTVAFDNKQEFSKQIEDLIGMIGQQRRYARTPDARVTVKGRFTADIQFRLCDCFLIVPDRSVAFLDQLRSDMVESLKSGAEMNGDWGLLKTTRDGDIRYQFVPPELKKAPADFVASEEEDVTL